MRMSEEQPTITAATTAPTTIAVVGGPGDGNAGGATDGNASGEIAVWHVQLAPQLTGDRLSGAWLIDPGADDAAATLANPFAGAAGLAGGAEAGGGRGTPGAAGGPAAGPVLAWASGLEELTATWAEVESERRRRDYLRDPWGAEARPLPLEYAAE